MADGQRPGILGEAAVETAQALYADGSSPAQILRHFALAFPNVGIPDLMALFQRAFHLEYADTQCIGGWWHDGSSELDDAKLNGFLSPSIDRSLGSF